MLQRERAALETAIKSLELALHPNTSEQEVLAGILGFRAKAKGRPLSEIAQTLYGGRYDGRTLPEYREEWEFKLYNQTVELQTLRVELRDLKRQCDQLQILLAKAVAERQLAVHAKLKAETKEKEARQAERAATAFARTTAKAAARVTASATRKERPICDSVFDVKFLRRGDRQRRTKGDLWDKEQNDYLTALYLENDEYSNGYLADRMNEKFGTHRTENSMRGRINRLREQGRLPQYRKGHERQKAAA